MRLYNENNMESLKVLEANSVDSIVTDPPYGLSFMNKKWDYDVPSVDFWKEVYRVLKPGGHILSFGGTRTYHRLVVAIEDAGFEIRDTIMWIYGSGFPKSLNIGKAVDKMEGNEREVVGTLENYQDKRGLNGQTENVSENAKPRIDIPLTKGQTEWEGFGTALKPAVEPICLARKPLSEKSISENVLRWGTGGLNIDGSRIGYETGSHPKDLYGESYMKSGHGKANSDLQSISGKERNGVYVNDTGRFPANVILECCCNVPDIHTNPDCPCYIMDEQSGVSKSRNKYPEVSLDNLPMNHYDGTKMKHISGREQTKKFFTDKGGASRFFYRAKVSKKERNLGLDEFEDKKLCQGGYGGEWYSEKESDIGLNKIKIHKNNHPTVKPINLLTYLCRLITPPNGVVLDPFMGSGSTGIAALLEGFDFVGMELDKDYYQIAQKRIENYELYRKIIK
jgi:DNA modification methylase